MCTTTPKVSVLIPICETRHFLGHCLNSLFNQTYQNYEVLLANAGCAPETMDICRNYTALDNRFIICSAQCGNAADALNAALCEASGDYLFFIDSDDVAAPDLLQQLITTAQCTGKQMVAAELLLLDFSVPNAQRRHIHCGELAALPEPQLTDTLRTVHKNAFAAAPLLRSVCGKLYTRTLWQQLKLHFSAKDFIASQIAVNQKYSACCNGIAFLPAIKYYYNDYPDSGALSSRTYRPGLPIRAICKGMRLVGRLIRPRSLGQRILQLEQKLRTGNL